MPKKEEAPRNVNALALSGLNGQSFTGLNIWRSGAVDIVEITTASGTTFLKFKQSQREVGGDANWGTGTQV